MARTISRQTLTVGILAVVAGLVAMYAVRSFLYQEEPPPPAAAVVPPIRFPVAAVDLPTDRVILEGDLIDVSTTKEELQKRFPGTDLERVMRVSQSVLHRRLKKPVAQTHPFLYSDFYLEGTGPNITDKLQPGFRAIRVQIPTSREVGLQPGAYVDVLFRASPRPARGGQLAIPEQTVTLLRHVEILDTDRFAGLPPGTKGTPRTESKSLLVTLAVPENKADIFTAIDGKGTLSLVATPSKEVADAGVGRDALTLEDVLGIQPPGIRRKPGRPQPPVPFETAIYRRNKLQINKFVDGKLVASHTSELGPRALEGANPIVPADAPAAPAAPPKEE